MKRLTTTTRKGSDEIEVKEKEAIEPRRTESVDQPNRRQTPERSRRRLRKETRRGDKSRIAPSKRARATGNRSRLYWSKRLQYTGSKSHRYKPAIKSFISISCSWKIRERERERERETSSFVFALSDCVSVSSFEDYCFSTINPSFVFFFLFYIVCFCVSCFWVSPHFWRSLCSYLFFRSVHFIFFLSLNTL